jgi:transposase
LVPVDEAGVNIAMGRSHAWVQRGEEYVEPRPMNWCDNLTLIGAMRADRWLTLGTCWRGVTSESFERWVRARLAPRLRPGDVVLLDNLRAHKSLRVRQLIERCRATVQFLPPYSHDLNPIEPAWALIKKRIRKHGPRTAGALRRVARAARHACGRAIAVSGFAMLGTSIQVRAGIK